MVPGRRRVLVRPEPADHHAVPHPGGWRPRESRLRLRRSSADDDRPHEAAGAFAVAADDPRPMAVAGGRLFVDVTQALGSPTGRAGLMEALGRSDPLIGDALQTLVERGDFIPTLPDEDPSGTPAGPALAPIETDPAIVVDLIARSEASVAAFERDIETKSGSALFDFILEDIQELKRILFDPHSHQVFMSAMEATWWLNEQLLGLAGREERGRHAHAIRSPQRHVRDGAGAAGPGGRDPAVSGGGGISAARRGRGFPGRTAQAVRAGKKSETRSRTSSTSTACAASVRSTSRGRVGANAPPCSCR